MGENLAGNAVPSAMAHLFFRLTTCTLFIIKSRAVVQSKQYKKYKYEFIGMEYCTRLRVTSTSKVQVQYYMIVQADVMKNVDKIISCTTCRGTCTCSRATVKYKYKYK